MAYGASISIDQLLALRHQARNIVLSAKNKALSQLAGSAKTHFRGRGLDFEEVRHYQAGDELRAIDWRVTARTSVPHTKLFREERERPVLVVIDQRLSMGFGSQHCFKSVQAAELAALLCWATLNNQDRIGGLVFNNTDHQEFRPARSRSAVLRIVQVLQQYNQQLINNGSSVSSSPGDEQINAVLQEIRQIARPGSAVFIISDFVGLNQDGLKQLHQIKRHCDISAIAVSDPMEHQLPDLGQAFFTDGQQKLGINVSSQRLRSDFAHRFEQRMAALRSELLARGIPFIPVSTSDNAADVLGYYYHRGRQPSPLRLKSARSAAYNR